MLVVYNKGVYKEYFETEYAEQISVSNEVFKANVDLDLTKYNYVLGNHLSFIGSNPLPHQTFIDVSVMGIDDNVLEKLGLEAIVYVYNNWYIPNDMCIRVDIPVNTFFLRRIPEDAKYVRVGLAKGNKRFDQIRQELENASRRDDFVGATWPTCHYLANVHYMILIYTQLTKATFRHESKPMQKIF